MNIIKYCTLILFVLLVFSCSDKENFIEITTPPKLVYPTDKVLISKNKINFEWEYKKGADCFDIYFENTKTGSVIEYRIDTANYEINRRNFDCGIEYLWTVRAVNEFQYYPSEMKWRFTLKCNDDVLPEPEPEPKPTPEPPTPLEIQDFCEDVTINFNDYYECPSDCTCKILYGNSDYSNEAINGVSKVLTANSYMWKIVYNSNDGNFSGEVEGNIFTINPKPTGTINIVISGTEYVDDLQNFTWQIVQDSSKYKVVVTRISGENAPEEILNNEYTTPQSIDFTPLNAGNYKINITAENACGSITENKESEYYIPPVICQPENCSFTTCANPTWRTINLTNTYCSTAPNIVKTSSAGDIFALPCTQFVHILSGIVNVYSVDKTMANAGLTVDKNRIAHGIYFASDKAMKYMRFDPTTTTLTKEIIQTGTAVTSCYYGIAAITIDQNDGIHTVYSGSGNFNGLNYARKINGSWEYEKISSNVIGNPHILINADNKILIIYVENKKLYIIRGTYGNWDAPELIGINILNGSGYWEVINAMRGLSFFQDCFKNIYIVYAGMYVGSNAGKIFKSEDDGASWTLIKEFQSYSQAATASADFDGNIWIAHTDGPGFGSGYVGIYKYNLENDTLDYIAGNSAPVKIAGGYDSMLNINCAGYPVVIHNDNKMMYLGCE